MPKKILPNPLEIKDEVEQSTTTMTLEDKPRFDYSIQKEIHLLYLQGHTPKAIAKIYQTRADVINSLLDNTVVRSEAEKSQLEVYRARENKRISEVKDKIVDFIELTIEEATDVPNKIQYLDKVHNSLLSLDKIGRLNRGESTENTTSKQTIATLNVNDLLAKLDTPEKRDLFLREQLEPNNN